tara:strand:+ start:166 stop:273 length:108 start_codon:yes stop_codon:yes gene_type:complete
LSVSGKVTQSVDAGIVVDEYCAAMVDLGANDVFDI